MSSDSTLRKKKMECTFLSSFCSFCISIASLFSPASPPFFLLSLFCRNLSTFPFFFLRCPGLIYPFYLPPVFGAISPLLRLSLILVSPGFLSPGEESKRFQEEASSVRRSLMTRMCTQMFCTVHLMVTSHFVCKMDEHC